MSTAITDANKDLAVALYFSDQPAATLTYGSIDVWDVSQLTSTDGMFENRYSFNSPLAAWDVSAVTSMLSMFKLTAFDQPLGFDTSSVTDMQQMFAGCFINQPIAFDTSSVGSMYSSTLREPN